MDAPDHSWLQSNGASILAPAGFLERGVVAPFSTPSLFGARLRPAVEVTDGFEVLIPNPAGREGWFILRWPSVVDAYHPTLADRALVAALESSAKAEPLPVRVREAAATMAMDGLGGRGLRRAAVAARAHAARLELTLRHRLDPSGTNAGLPAGRFLHCGVDVLEGLLAPRIGAVTAMVGRLRDLMHRAVLEEDRHRIARLATRAAAMVAPAQALMEAGRMRPSEGSGAATMPSPEAERPHWLLDGWDLLAAMLAAMREEEQLVLLRRATELVPPLPAEGLGWPGCGTLAALEAGATPHEHRRAASASQPIAATEAALALWLQPGPFRA